MADQEREKKVSIGKKAPLFSLFNDRGEKVSLQDFQGQWVVLYFYPRDSTPGCTKEALAFTEALPKFKRCGAVVIGVSPDSAASHGKFRASQKLKVELLSDPEKKVLKAYGAYGQKKLYGKTYFGVLRTTYLINPKGHIASVWEKVKVAGHVEKVLEALKRIKGESRGG